MLRELHLKDVGPSRALDFAFAPRLNVLTGDNGLGKSFVLDVAWWVLTTTWAGEKALPWLPRAPLNKEDLAPEIAATLALPFETPPRLEDVDTGGTYQWNSQDWSRKRWERRRDTVSHPPDYPPYPPSTLVVYARLDGGFAIWDGYQVRSESNDHSEATVLLDPTEVWEGKEIEGQAHRRRRTVSRGLLEDWMTWQVSQSREYELLREILSVLSEPDEPLVPGPPTRVRLNDRRDEPTLETPYGLVPVTLASAGQRRILSLAYMLVWAWAEHLKAASVTRRAPTHDMVVLIDEAELHLHPRWQRVFIPALLAAIRAMTPDVSVQLILTTHAPLVLASLEPIFDEDQDNLYRFEREGSSVVAHNLSFAKQGDAANWLVSESFGLELARSAPSEAAIQAASDYMRGDTTSAEAALSKAVASLDAPPIASSAPLKDRIHAALLRLLPGHDDFWPRWIVSYEHALRHDEESR